MSADKQDAPVCAYEVLTGPVPPGLTPGEMFTHTRVSVGPEVAYEMLKRRLCTPDLNMAAHLSLLMEAGPPHWQYCPSHRVSVDVTGCVVGGLEILTGVLSSNATVELDVVHNTPVGTDV